MERPFPTPLTTGKTLNFTFAQLEESVDISEQKEIIGIWNVASNF
jgi:hypothetical protein